MAKNTGLIVVLILVGVYLVYSGALGNILGGTQTTTPPPASVAKCPSDLKTTMTLNTKDGLATTATNANVSYYVFKSDGQFLKSGTTAAGTASFDVQCGGNYQLIAYDDDGTAPDYYPETVSFTADAGEGSLKTINMNLNKESVSVKVNDFRDPVDLNRNLSISAGATVAFEAIWSVNQSNAAIKNPTLVIDANNTCIDDIAIPSYSKTTCPSRLTGLTTESKKYCFRKEGIVTSSDGLQTVPGTVLFDATKACRTTVTVPDSLQLVIIDDSMYRDADFATKGTSAFHVAAENVNDNSNVGMADSDAQSYTLDGKYYLYFAG